MSKLAKKINSRINNFEINKYCENGYEFANDMKVQLDCAVLKIKWNFFYSMLWVNLSIKRLLRTVYLFTESLGCDVMLHKFA